MALITQAPLNGYFVLAEAEGERSRATGNVAAGTQVLPPGTLVDGAFTTDVPVNHAPAAAAADVTGILLYWADPTGGAAVRAPFIVRDAEVNEGYLIFGALDREKVADQLATVGIIVRRGVLSAPGATFGLPPATDPALANSVYGPQGLDALDPGGIYGTATVGQVTIIDPEAPPDTTEPQPPLSRAQDPQATDRPPPPVPA